MKETHPTGGTQRPRTLPVAVWRTTLERMRRAGRAAAAVAVAVPIALTGTAGAATVLAPAANAASGVTQYNYGSPGGTLPSGDTGAGMGQIYTESGSAGSVTNVSLGSSWTPAPEGVIRTFCIQYGVPFNSSGSWVETQLYAQNAARAAWVIQNYAYRTPFDDAAIAEMIHWFVEGQTTSMVLNILNSTPDGGATFARAQQLWNASAPYSGSYTSPTPALQQGTVPGTGTVGNTQIGSATAPNIGVPVTFALTGPAVFDATGTNTLNGTSGDTPAWHVVGAGGLIQVTETSSAVPDHLRVFTQAGNQTQTTAPADVTLKGSSQDVTVFAQFQPIATSTAPVYLNAGDPLTDVLHVATSDGLPWMNDANGNPVPAVFDIQWLYYPAAQAPATAVPAGGTPAATGTGTATAAGDITVTGGAKAGQAGYYYPVASFAKANQPQGLQQWFTGDWKAGFSDPGEQSLVKWTPQVSTHISFQPGGKVCDEITVIGNNPVQKATVASTLYMTNQGTVAGGTGTAPADAKVLGTMSTDVTGNATATNCITLTAVQLLDLWTHGYPNGNTFFQETIAATPTTNAWTGKYLLPEETKPLPMPTVTTTASANGTAPLTGAYDTFHATGPFDVLNGIPGLAFQAQAAAYKFGTALDGSDQAYCLNPNWTSDWIKVDTAKDYQTNTHTIDYTGQTGYVETLQAVLTVNGQTTTTVLHTGKCGEVAEGTTTFPAAVPVSPDKPAAPNAPAAAPAAPAAGAPLADTGYQAPADAAQADPSGVWLPLEIGGGILLAGLIVLAGALVQRNRAHRKAENLAGAQGAGTDSLLG